MVTLYAFDHELTRAERIASDSLIAEIRLTWWSEALDEIFGGKTVRAQPLTRSLEGLVRRHNLPRQPLDAMIEARIEALGQAHMNMDAAVRWAVGSAGSAAVLAAAILDPASPADAAALAGRVWGLATLVRQKRADRTELAGSIGRALGEARQAGRRLSAAAFPAAAHATLARGMLRGDGEPELIQRFRLVWAVASGRL